MPEDNNEQLSKRLLVQEGKINRELLKTLGALDLTLIGIGASIGSGIFVLSGVALHEAGPGVALSFMVAAGVCVLDALCYAELASRWPTSGGAYLFTKKVFGAPWSLVIGLNLLIDYHVGAAAIARSFAGYLRKLAGSLPAASESNTQWLVQLFRQAMIQHWNNAALHRCVQDRGSPGMGRPKCVSGCACTARISHCSSVPRRV